jgi:hypothetical protein
MGALMGPTFRRSLAEKQEKKEHEGREGHEEDDVWSRD